MTHIRSPLYLVRASLCTIGLFCAMLVGASVLPREARCSCQDPVAGDNEEEDEDAVGGEVKSGDDFQPGTQDEKDTYKKSTLEVKFPGFDGTKVTFFKTLAWRATTNLIGGFLVVHCRDSGGMARKHVHHQNDYDAPAKTNANDFWDLRFDTKNKTTTQVIGATNVTNCYAYALATFTKKGKYSYWMNAKPENDGEALECFKADTTTVSILALANKAQINDVMVYGLVHATGIADVDCAGWPKTLRWQWNGSGIYEYAVPANAADRMHSPDFRRKEFGDPATVDKGPGAADTVPPSTVRRPKT